ncbi:hypothetical protein [Mesorhizobium sp. M0088]|uniref:hypothetical protein n=1 Tax=Mesorhizobium sp. M0088 TaxID=2956873 RepID=UPI00333AE9AD
MDACSAIVEGCRHEVASHLWWSSFHVYIKVQRVFLEFYFAFAADTPSPGDQGADLVKPRRLRRCEIFEILGLYYTDDDTPPTARQPSSAADSQNPLPPGGVTRFGSAIVDTADALAHKSPRVEGTFMRSGIRILLAMMAILSAVVISNAATIGKSNSPNCVMVISGEIVQGDFEKFVALGKVLLPGDDGESTSHDKVCLDSPGGNLAEGVKFAKYFYHDGVGTVIDGGQKCYSACAVMFMMGTATGAEVAFANRKLHVGGKLGFHRPYIDISSGTSIDSGTLRFAYDAAFSSALDLIAVANSKAPWSSQPMMKPDLIQGMLQHIGNDMLMIDSVDKVGRWDIEVIGAAEPSLLSEEQAFYACENSLQWQNGLTTEDISYSKYSEGSSGRRSHLLTGTEQTAFQVEGLASGYAMEGCVISKKENALLGCGIDEYSDARLGQGDCDQSSYADRSVSLKKISVFNPATRLEELRPGKPSPAKQPGMARCFVIKGEHITDNEPCLIVHIDDAKMNGSASMVTHFVWPSGSKTVLVQSGSAFEINGVPTSKRKIPDRGDCYLNSATQNDFCVLANSN